MPKNVYAFLVGIDEYVSPTPRLRGCVNDIEDFVVYLQQRISDATQLKIQTLKNTEAKRQAVIDGFRNHLGQAGADDVALFYYSGHGSQEQAPPEFWLGEPDHQNETLVCYDSRLPGGWDLADKELSKLINEVAAKCPHLVVILDCCHSGSGTRDLGTDVRRAPSDTRVRPLKTYIVSSDEVAEVKAQTRSTRSAGASPASAWETTSTSRHVLMAACRDHELAKEIFRDGRNRGALSYFLSDSLKKSTGVPTYRELFARITALTKNQVVDQSPQLEANVDTDLDRVFLDGTVRTRSTTFTASFSTSQSSWIINAGLASGIPAVDTAGPVKLALFSFDADAAALQAITSAVATAEVQAVGPAQSTIKLLDGKSLDTKQVFKALVIDLPVPAVPIAFEGEATGRQLLVAALAKSSPKQTASLFIRQAKENETAQFRITAQSDSFIIARIDSDRPIVAPIVGSDQAAAEKAIERMEHIVRWQQTSSLHNLNSSLAPGDLQIIFKVDQQEVKSSDIRLEYKQKDGKWIKPTFQLGLRNLSNRTLFCAMLNLTQRFQVTNLFGEQAGCARVEAGQEVWVLDGKALGASVPDELWQQGIIEHVDLIKVIACTQELDGRLLEQPALELAKTRKVAQANKASLSSLGRLMRRVQTRDIVSADDDMAIDDWQTWDLSFTTVRPLTGVAITKDGPPVEVNSGVLIAPHPALTGQAALSNAAVATRDLGNAPFPSILSDAPEYFEPLAFTSSRATSPGLNVLELRGVNDSTLVTADAPLRITIPQAISSDESILPIAFDGEFYIPLGRVEQRLPDATVISIERLTPPLADTRSLFGAIKIFFHKTISRLTGLEFSYPRLMLVAYDNDGNQTQITSEGEIRQKLAGASRVALFVHGIIGETANMVPCMRDVLLESGKPLGSMYDAILTFDYENLGTSVKENAELLKVKLERVGLSAGEPKRLDIVAHSMGGLVSRWYIENCGGNQVVRRLVMLGTPNGGSPWPTVVNWATVALAMGLNHYLAIPVAASALTQLMPLIDDPRRSLKDMQIQSAFLKDLEKCGDPKVPYYLIAGNTSLIPITQPTSNAEVSRWRRLMNRVTSPQFLQTVAEPFFLGAPNDIAVSVGSMENVPVGRNPNLTVRSVACNHLNYFTEAAGQKVLIDFLK